MWRHRTAESNEAKTKPDLLRKYGDSLDCQLNYKEGSAIHDRHLAYRRVEEDCRRLVAAVSGGCLQVHACEAR